MLEVDFDDLDLGSRRKPTEWVAVLPPSAQQPRQRSSRYCLRWTRCLLLSSESLGSWASTISMLELLGKATLHVLRLCQLHAFHRQVLKAQKMQQAHRKQQEDKPQGAVKKPGMPSTHAARMQQLAQCTDVRQPRPISDEDAAAGAHAFPAEDDEGNVEYKLRLKEPTCSPVRFQQLVGGTYMHKCIVVLCNTQSASALCIALMQCSACRTIICSRADEYHISLHYVPLTQCVVCVYTLPQACKHACEFGITRMGQCTIVQVTQMKYRLAEGNGECFYFIGET